VIRARLIGLAIPPHAMRVDFTTPDIDRARVAGERLGEERG
jgi:hypothetical protein